VSHRGMAVSMDHPQRADLRLVANPIHMSRTPVSYGRPPPLLGGDTDDVLSRLLDLDEAERAALRSAGVI
jgi:crotonobetainyl-CoA:carnitine CoA-transferase CaiB-like acyl-CoA transferase